MLGKRGEARKRRMRSSGRETFQKRKPLFTLRPRVAPGTEAYPQDRVSENSYAPGPTVT